MTDRALLQQALEALNSIAWPKGSVVFLTITALRERLAQPEPPPECKTEEEKTAFAFGWLKAMEAQRMGQQEHKPGCALLKIPSRDCDCQPDPMPLFDDWPVFAGKCPPCNQRCEQGRLCPARGKA